MRLHITTPLTIAVDEEIKSLRAEDESGGFGILPHHAGFLTRLTISLVSWETPEGVSRYCAVRGGALTVTQGNIIRIATREAVVGDDLNRLNETILTKFRGYLDIERVQHVEGTRLQLNAIRQIMRHLRPSASRGSVDFT